MSGVDVVGIFDSEFQQVFVGARPIKALIGETAKTMDHPTETGATVTDHRVLLPVTIDLSIILDPAEFRQVYQNIRRAFQLSTLFTVQTKSGGYQNMMIADMPHDEDPATFDTIAMALKMQQVQFVTAQFVKLPANKVRAKAQQSTKDRGQQAPKTPTASTQARSQSMLSRIFN